MQLFYAGNEVKLSGCQKEAIKKIIRKNNPESMISADLVVETMRRYYGFDVRTKSRFKPRPDAKKIFSHILCTNGYTITEIGVILDVDHTTICHHLDRFEDYYATKDPIIKDYLIICERLGIEPAEPTRFYKNLIRRVPK